jgi:hypothetical protein
VQRQQGKKVCRICKNWQGFATGMEKFENKLAKEFIYNVKSNKNIGSL